MRFFEKLSMKDLFYNKDLEGIIPQFEMCERLQNVRSFDWIEDKIKNYIKMVFSGQFEGDALIIKGKHKTILRAVQGLKITLEALYDNLPKIIKGLRKDTKLFLPFQSIEQVKMPKILSPTILKKIFLHGSILFFCRMKA